VNHARPQGQRVGRHPQQNLSAGLAGDAAVHPVVGKEPGIEAAPVLEDRIADQDSPGPPPGGGDPGILRLVEAQVRPVAQAGRAAGKGQEREPRDTEPAGLARRAGRRAKAPIVRFDPVGNEAQGSEQEQRDEQAPSQSPRQSPRHGLR